MARVLVYTVDVDVPGRPIDGGMLRVRQLCRLLRGLGHEVTVSMPLEALLGSGGAGDVIEAAHDGHNPARVALDFEPDLVICAQWHLVPALGALDCPLWLDLHGSLLAENAFRHEGGAESAARYGQEVLAKLAAFGRADAVTCTGARQRLYFRGWRAIVGGTYNDWDVEHLPLSLEPEAEAPAPCEGRGLRYLFAGNLWPWIDLGSWLPEFFGVIAERPHDEVHFFVDDPIDRRDGQAVIVTDGGGPGLERLMAEGRCVVKSRMAHDEYRNKAREYDIALDLFGPNLERELAVTTRTLEYLAFGIPVLYPRHAELSEVITEHGCGWVLDPLEAGAIRSTVATIDADAVRQRTIAARTGPALESLERQATSRCAGVLERILTPAGGRRTLGGEGRFEARLGAVAVEDLRTTRRQLGRGRETIAALEQKLREREQSAIKERRELEQELQEKEGDNRQLERTTVAAEERIVDLKRTAADMEADATDLQRQLQAEKCRVEELGRVLSDRQERIAALGEELAEDRRLLRQTMAWNQKRVGARQAALAVKTAAPRSSRRGVMQRLRLLVLYLDHILTRGYLAVWQRIRRQRIFPGM